MTITAEIKDSLEREYSICTKAMSFYKKQIRKFEKKYMMNTSVFLARFEAGSMGDDTDFFDWYAFHNLLKSWAKTQHALHSFIK